MRTMRGSDVSDVREATGWELRVAPDVTVTVPPSDIELSALRGLDPLEIA